MSSTENSKPDNKSHRNRVVSTRDKAAAVLRVLAGEDAQSVADNIEVSLRRVNEWKENFLEGGQAALQTSSRKPNLAAKTSARSKSIAQWAVLIIALTVVIFVLVEMLQRQPAP